MYLEYFGFREKPFNVTPDPRFFYINPSYQEAYASLLYGIYERKGFVVLIGEVGTGKTTLLRRLMSDLGSNTPFCFFYNTNLTFDELLTFTCEDLCLQVKGLGRLQKILVLNEFLIKQLKAGGTAALLIDEAQNLGDEVLEDLRLLSNLETSTEKLLQIVLVGQPELEDKLGRQGLRQLKQRISTRCRLQRLENWEVDAFIHYRLGVIEYNGHDPFTAEAIQLIAYYSGGIPRLINIICDNAFLICYGTSQKTVSAQVIDEVAHDLRLKMNDPAASSGVSGIELPISLTPQAAGKSTLVGLKMEDHSQALTEKPPAVLPPLPPAETGDTDKESTRPATRDPIQGRAQDRPRHLARFAAAAFLLLSVLGSVGFVSYSQQIRDQIPPLKLRVKGLLKMVEERLNALSYELVSRTTGHTDVRKPLGTEPSNGAAVEIQTQEATNPNGKHLVLGEKAAELSPSTQSDESNHAETNEKLSTLESRPAAEVNGVVKTRGEPSWKESPFVIKRGTIVSKIISEVYGEYNTLAIDLIKEFNPHIQNLNRIRVGQKLWLPPLTQETLLREQPDGSYRLILASFRSSSEANEFAQVTRQKGYAVVIIPRRISDNILTYRVEIEELKTSEAVHKAWLLVDLDTIPFNVPVQVKHTNAAGSPKR